MFSYCFSASHLDFISRKVQASIPALLFLVPPPDSASDFKEIGNWRAFGCQSLLHDDLKRLLNIKIEKPFRGIPFELLEIKHHDRVWYTEGIPVSELLEYLRDSTVDLVKKFYGQHFFDYGFNFVALMRQIWERISGQVRHHQIESPIEKWSMFEKNLLNMRSQNPGIPFPPRHQAAKENPFLLYVNDKQASFLSLKKNIINSFGKFPKKLDASHKENWGSSENPFAIVISKFFYDIEHAAKSVFMGDFGSSDLNSDQKFIKYLEDKKILNGIGEYRNVSIESGVHEHRQTAKLVISLGTKPFLMQMNSTPIFVLWNLSKYPIRVVLENFMHSDGEINFLDYLHFKAESTHKSILRHPFVNSNGSKMVDQWFRGNMCVEETHLRVLSMHKAYGRHSLFDPAVCLLEQLRGAARVLKFGVCFRDRNINKYNDFSKISRPELTYQAIVKGWNNANAFAKKHNAEIVRYMR
jgi:hypothetical protein